MDKLRSKKRYKTYRNKRIIHPEDTTVINRYELNNRTSKYMKKKTDRIKGSNRHLYNHSRRLKYLTSSNG